MALGAVAGARRTASAYGRYLTSINASDVFVNVPGRLPGMSATQPITLISSLPGVVSHAAYIGLNGLPVVHGKVDDNFLDNSVNGSLDGEYFSQDRATVLSGQLPPEDRPAPCCYPGHRQAVRGRRGEHGQLQVPAGEPSGPADAPRSPAPTGWRPSSRCRPPWSDESDISEGTILPPGATRQLLSAYYYAWIGLRLVAGPAGIPNLQRQLSALSTSIENREEQATGQKEVGPVFTINRTDVVHNQVQQAIMPEAVALSLFGVISALALLVLVGQGLVQMINRSAPDIAVLRALGATRGTGRGDRGRARADFRPGRRGPGRSRRGGHLAARPGGASAPV